MFWLPTSSRSSPKKWWRPPARILSLDLIDSLQSEVLKPFVSCDNKGIFHTTSGDLLIKKKSPTAWPSLCSWLQREEAQQSAQAVDHQAVDPLHSLEPGSAQSQLPPESAHQPLRAVH